MIDLLKDYAGKKVELLKLEATEKSSLTAGTITYLVIIGIAFTFFIILLNIGLGLLIGDYLNNYAYGLLAMAGFYFLIIVLVLLFRNFIKNFVANKVINAINP